MYFRQLYSAICAELGVLTLSLICPVIAAAQNPTPVAVLEGDTGTGNFYFGNALCSPGDLSGDGVRELVVAQYYANPFQTGKVFVFSGASLSVTSTYVGT